MQDKYDTAFLGILQNEGEISKFLDSLFSFLYRKTDFYILLNSPSERLGFPSGVSKKLVLSAYQKYEAMALQDQKRKEAAKEKVSTSDPKPTEEQTEVPDVARVEEVTAVEDVVTTEIPKTSVPSNTTSDSQPAPSDDHTAEATPLITEATPQPEPEGTSLPAADTAASKDGSDKHQETKDENLQTSTTAAASKANDDEDDDPELTRLQKIFQANPESYNGAIRENYSWSQSITDVDARVKVPKHVRKGKDVTVVIGKKHIKVSCKDANGQTVVIVDGDLIWECHKDECVWSLVPGEHVHINLEKVEERWWDALLTDEPKINVRKIDPSRPMTDLDDEAQAKIEEMMYNEQQKRLGRPQSHEKKVHDMLEKAWDAEGSPFKGQPFDPSKINVSPGGLS